MAEGGSPRSAARVLIAICLVASGTAGCLDRAGSDAPRGGHEAVYFEALGAVLDTLGLPPERLVFPDRFVALGSFTDTESGPRDLFETLAGHYPRSRVCSYEDCSATDGETMVLVSRIPTPVSDTAHVAITTYIYEEGNVFGDGWRLRLGYADQHWGLTSFARFHVPE